MFKVCPTLGGDSGPLGLAEGWQALSLKLGGWVASQGL